MIATRLCFAMHPSSPSPLRAAIAFGRAQLAARDPGAFLGVRDWRKCFEQDDVRILGTPSAWTSPRARNDADRLRFGDIRLASVRLGWLSDCAACRSIIHLDEESPRRYIDAAPASVCSGSRKERCANFRDRSPLRLREAVRDPFLPSLALPSSG